MAESDQDNSETSVEDVATEQVDPYKTVLAQITNPKGEQKYADALTALESIQPKDDMIVKLQEELAEGKLKTLEMEDELSKRDSTEELVKKVMENRNQQSTETPSGDEAEKKIDIGELVRQEILGISAENSRVSNRERVASALAEQYGDKANEVLTTKMEELQVSPEFFRGVIEQSPVAALELLGLKVKPKAAPAKPQGSVRADSFSQSTSEGHSSVMLADSAEISASWDAHMKEVIASR